MNPPDSMYNIPSRFNFSTEETIKLPTEANSSVGQDVVSDSLYWIFGDLGIAIGFALGIGGIVGNVLTLRAFWRMGLDDSVTIGFFNLTISDLAFLIVELVNTNVVLYESVNRNHPRRFALAVTTVSLMCWDITRSLIKSTVYLTTFLAVQRCLCVILPLHFKGMFTRRRTFIIVAVIWGYCVITRVVKFSSYEVVTMNYDGLIIQYLTTKISKHFLLYYWADLEVIFMRPFCQIVVTICTLVIVYALKKSVQFRQATTSSSSLTRTKKGPDGSRERQAMVQVSLVSAILVVTSFPTVILGFVDFFFPNAFPLGYSEFIRFMLFRCEEKSCMANSAVNFFIYYKYNTKFRQVCFQHKTKK